ncbi:MAG: lytic murein transglycosylase B [Pseudomonadota bacterium]|nr:lytic murein transglycosylase B [Pseudomonadota bacterium]
MIILVGQTQAVLGENYSSRDDVREFIKSLVIENFSESELLKVFREAEYKQNIIEAISRPAEKVLAWSDYQDIFLREPRISAGKRFMETYDEPLQRASEEYGVPPALLTAVIGVETMYGRYLGNYRVLDALVTLAFDYPPRATFFRKELYEFFMLVREEKQEITDLKGSYAGAMGYGQFISSSYRRYAVDFDGDGIRDIWRNPVDAIGSVANYLSEHGWSNGQVVVRIDADDIDESIFNVSLKPSITIADLEKFGVSVAAPRNERVSPMKLLGKQGSEYWLGFNNFYVITRYNHSKLYAMAVYQLSEALNK